MGDVPVQVDAEAINLEGRSARYVRFHQAFELASKKANEKWTDQDCASCFPLIAQEIPQFLQKIREEAIQEGREYYRVQELEMSKRWNVADRIDKFHASILESRRRAQVLASVPPDEPIEEFKDLWRPDIDPRAAVRAHTVPLLRAELQRVKDEIAQRETQNQALDAEMRNNIAAHENATARVKTLLLGFREIIQNMSTIPLEDMEQWSLAVEEDGLTR